MNPNKIGKFIFKLRTENHLSQYQLADKIPISRQAVSKWERGQTIPDSSTLIRLSEIFDVTINELLNGERKEINTIKELEKTTLSIVDENNKKTKVVRILLDTFIVTIFVLIICFFIYYFINSYKTIKVYTINGKGKEFDIYDGVLLVTKQKSYLKTLNLKLSAKQEQNLSAYIDLLWQKKRRYTIVGLLGVVVPIF